MNSTETIPLHKSIMDRYGTADQTIVPGFADQHCLDRVALNVRTKIPTQEVLSHVKAHYEEQGFHYDPLNSKGTEYDLETSSEGEDHPELRFVDSDGRQLLSTITHTNEDTRDQLLITTTKLF